MKQAGGPLCLQVMFMKSDLDLPSIDDSVDVTSSDVASCQRLYVININVVNVDVVTSMTLFDIYVVNSRSISGIENKWEIKC